MSFFLKIFTYSAILASNIKLSKKVEELKQDIRDYEFAVKLIGLECRKIEIERDGAIDIANIRAGNLKNVHTCCYIGELNTGSDEPIQKVTFSEVEARLWIADGLKVTKLIRGDTL